MRTMRDLIRIIESTGSSENSGRLDKASYFLHISPPENLIPIMENGLRQKDNGNYSGYETSLPGVYVTRIPQIAHQHIMAREISDHYVIVVVCVKTPAVIDEDAIDEHLHNALSNVLKKHATTIDELAEDYQGGEDDDYPYEKVGVEMMPYLLTSLGTESTNNQSKLRGLLTEFCAAWFGERIVGGDGPEGDWWRDAKEQIVRSFPMLSHAKYGADYSLRLPSPVGYLGETRIVTVIDVENNKPKIAKGALPQEAEDLVNDVIS